MKTTLNTLIIYNLIFSFWSLSGVTAQNIGINGTGANAHPSALLDLDASPSNNTGFAMPSLTTTQRIAIVAPKDGLQVYDTSLKGFYYFNTTTNRWDCVTVPAGSIGYFGNITAPIGYLECNGQAVSRTTYPELFNAISTLYGIGDGATTFNLPDLRGEFIRGVDNGRGVDAGRVLGTLQQTSLTNVMNGTTYNGNNPANVDLFEFTQLDTDAHFDDIGIQHTVLVNTALANSGNTAPITPYGIRPRNLALLSCIKY